VLQGPAFCFETSWIPLTCPPSAQRSDTLLVTAPRLVDTEAKVDLAVVREATVVADTVAVVAKAVKLATLAEATVTCLVSCCLLQILFECF